MFPSNAPRPQRLPRPLPGADNRQTLTPRVPRALRVPHGSAAAGLDVESGPDAEHERADICAAQGGCGVVRGAEVI
jgi:hypothetical protein